MPPTLPSWSLSLLADGAANWTDKEMLIAVGSTAAGLFSLFFFVLRKFVSWERRERIKAENALKRRINREPPELISPDPGQQPALERLERELQEARTEADRLTTELNATEAAMSDRIAGAQRQANELEATLSSAQSDLAAERRRIQRALQSRGGQVWSERVRANAPEFDRLEPEVRRTPIISVLNLKGGVGKTTVVANLGAALDARGWRTLFLDLDLQGSLTGLFMTEERQRELFDGGRLMGDFLESSFGAEFPNMLDFVEPVLPGRRSGVVATADTLAYAETNLAMRWMLREANRDPRFLLRKELQLKRITNNYDVILLDCPPLMNVCCVNALAASDYVLIPVLPSAQATARVPVLLKRLVEIRENINPYLSVLGVLLNRTHRDELTADERSRLGLLRGQCRDVWGQDVCQLETTVRQSPAIRAAEDEHRPLGPDDDVFATFGELAAEIEGLIPTFCLPSRRSTAPTREGVA